MPSAGERGEANVQIEALLATIDAAASGLTICRVAAGIRLSGVTFGGVSVLQVIAGRMRLELPGRETVVARAGQLVLVPGGLRPVIASDVGPPAETVDGRHCLVRREGWLVADATRGRPMELEVAAARLTATTERSLGRVVVASLGAVPEGRQALAMLRAELARAAPGSGTLAVTLMSACIVIALRIALAAQSGTARVTDRRASIDRALAAVRSRPADPHCIDTLAEAAG